MTEKRRKKRKKNERKLLTVTLKVSLEQLPPEVPGAVVISSVDEGPRRVKDSKSSRKKQTSESYKLYVLIHKLQVTA